MCFFNFIIKVYLLHFSFVPISLFSLQKTFSQPVPMQILTKLWDISQVSYLLHSSNQQPSPANTDHLFAIHGKNCALFLLWYVLTAFSTSYRVPWGQKLYSILSLFPRLCFQWITSVSVFWEGSIFLILPPKSIFIKLNKIRFLLSIILQALASFILRGHALKNKPDRKPSSTTYYMWPWANSFISLSLFPYLHI